MNLIRFEAHELADDGTGNLTDRRGRHVQEVLRSQPGDRLQVGLLNGPVGEAEVLQVEPQPVLRCAFAAESPRAVTHGK